MNSRDRSFEKGWVGRISAAALIPAMLGCSSSNVAGSRDGGGTGSPGSASGAFPYPAFTPSMPQIVKGGSLPVIASSTVVPVYFSGDTLQPALDTALRAWPASAAFKALGEYGITSTSIGSSIVLSETPSAMLTAQEVQTWIEGKLDGTHPEFGPVDVTTLASKDFVIFYPASTTVTSYGVSLCNGDQFNAAVTLPSGAVANYDAVAECSAPPGPNQVTFLAWDAVYGVTAQLGSPDPDLQPYPSNWGNYDTAHAAYQLVPATGNLQGACSLARLNWVGTGPNAVPILLDAGVPLDAGPGVTWSNNAAAGYHDPCIPDLPGPYFVSVPVTRDAVQVTTNPFTTPPMVVTSPGVLVPVGSAKTVDLQLLSDAPTSGPWTVSAEVLDSSGFTFAFDRTTGQNGDVLHLSITAPSAPQQGTAVVYSTLEGRRTFYVFPMESK